MHDVVKNGIFVHLIVFIVFIINAPKVIQTTYHAKFYYKLFFNFFVVALFSFLPTLGEILMEEEMVSWRIVD